MYLKIEKYNCQVTKDKQTVVHHPSTIVKE